MTIAFLLGGVAAATYFTLAADNNVNKDNKKDKFFATQVEKGENYSMKQLDSLTAASNIKFTRRNAVDYSVIDTTAFKKL
jgi:hypothetical protein